MGEFHVGNLPLLPKDEPADLNFKGDPAFEYAYPAMPFSDINTWIDQGVGCASEMANLKYFLSKMEVALSK